MTGQKLYRGGGVRRLAGLAGTLAAILAGILATGTVVAPAPARAGGKALSGTMTVNGGAQYSTSSTVTVVALVRGATTMRYRNPDGSYTPWETYAATKSLDLGADGPKVVEGQFKGSTGKRVVLKSTITVDSTGPTTTSDYDGVPRAVVTLDLTAVDALSGVASTWYRLDGGTWREGTRTTLCLARKRSGLRPGAHTVEFYSTDVLGNVGPVGSSVVVLK